VLAMPVPEAEQDRPPRLPSTSTATAAAGLRLSENLAAGDRVDRGGPDFLAEPSVSRGTAPAISGAVRSPKALVESTQVAQRLSG
jgi:hypothetical protein